MNLRSGTAFEVLMFSRRRRRSPLSLRPPATFCQPFGLRNTADAMLLKFINGVVWRAGVDGPKQWGEINLSECGRNVAGLSPMYR
jgi:hypothetical protein